MTGEYRPEQPSLDGVRLKLGRAEEHLGALDAEIGRYFATKPYMAIREYDPEGNRLAGLSITQDPPAYLALMIGDYLHNARSALDHLAWQLVLASGHTPTAQTKFPIFKNPRTKKKRGGGIVIRPGVSAPIRALVEGLQPYHGADPSLHPLWTLHDLANIDKHRTLHTTAVWVSNAERFDIAPPGHDTPRPTFLFLHRPRETDVTMHAQSALSVALTEPADYMGKRIVGLLSETLKFIQQAVLPRFEPFFD